MLLRIARCAPGLFLLLSGAACDGANAPVDAGGGDGGGADASIGDAGEDAGVVDPLEARVRAASWTEVAGAPTAGGGAKQDDIFFVDPQHAFLASGPNFAIYATDDGGTTWSESFANPGTYFRAVLFTDAMHGFAGNLGAGLSPQISDATALYRTVDGGATWTAVTEIDGLVAPDGICNLTAADPTHLFAIGRANGPSRLLSSSDGGASWTAISLDARLMMAIDGRFTSPTEGIVVGMGPGLRCTVVRTTDGGDSFDTVFESATPNSLCWKIDFPSDDVGFVAVQDTSTGPGTFARTMDGGETWEELPLPMTTAYPAIGVGFLNDRIGWMASEDASLPVYRTFDGGETWEEEPELVGPINRFRVVDEDTVFAVGASVWRLDLPAGG
ncbi:MAG: WD40/YVTN/BNR-like repeat-containing protein [Sandaracinaceae bacterium]